jgi:dTDP-4-dehydrorhamnose 3,5-epimerase
MKKRIEIIKTEFDGLVLINHNFIEDQRGFLNRLFCKEEFESLNLVCSFVQMNHTLTKKKGAIRGLHFQHAPFAETKVISCIKGEVFDVAVDMREDSPTYLKWYSTILSEDNKKSIYIPEGFAHGFQALTNNCQLIYCHSNFYNPNAENGLNAMDPLLAIDWPEIITEISERDSTHKMLDNLLKE